MKAGEGRQEIRPLTRVRVRLLLLGLCTSLAVVAVAARLAYLTIVAKEEYEARGLVQYQQRLKLDARRGTIFDRNGQALAESVEVDSLYAVPSAFSPERAQEAAGLIARCLEYPAAASPHPASGAEGFRLAREKGQPRGDAMRRGAERRRSPLRRGKPPVLPQAPPRVPGPGLCGHRQRGYGRGGVRARGADQGRSGKPYHLERRSEAARGNSGGKASPPRRVRLPDARREPPVHRRDRAFRRGPREPLPERDRDRDAAAHR